MSKKKKASWKNWNTRAHYTHQQRTYGNQIKNLLSAQTSQALKRLKVCYKNTLYTFRPPLKGVLQIFKLQMNLFASSIKPTNFWVLIFVVTLLLLSRLFCVFLYFALFYFFSVFTLLLCPIFICCFALSRLLRAASASLTIIHSAARPPMYGAFFN